MRREQPAVSRNPSNLTLSNLCAFNALSGVGVPACDAAAGGKPGVAKRFMLEECRLSLAGRQGRLPRCAIFHKTAHGLPDPYRLRLALSAAVSVPSSR